MYHSKEQTRQINRMLNQKEKKKKKKTEKELFQMKKKQSKGKRTY